MVPVYVVLSVPPSLAEVAAVLAVIRAKKDDFSGYRPCPDEDGPRQWPYLSTSHPSWPLLARLRSSSWSCAIAGILCGLC
jgi:hypothetical protein